MSETQTTVTLTPAASTTLEELQSLTGHGPTEVLATAIERMAEEERAFASKIEAAREDIRAGRTVSLEDAERRFRATIARATRRRA